MKDFIVAIILTVIMVLNFFDVLTDISLGVPQWHIIEECMIVLVSGIGAVLLFWEIRRRTHYMLDMRNHLRVSHQQLQHMTEEMKAARHQYSELINNQFDQWQLTMSEKEVSMLLLKGLSFREISTLRETKEKTVRQQASTIYDKAGVNGRHEFAAFFFEDFVTP